MRRKAKVSVGCELMMSCLYTGDGKARLDRSTVQVAELRKKPLIKTNCGPQNATLHLESGQDFTSQSLQGSKEGIERLGHSLSKPFQFSPV